MIATEAVEKTAIDFNGLVREHQAMVYSVAWHFLRDRPLAEEVAQDVFFSLHRNLRSIESPRHAVAWLRKVAVQRAIDAGRRRKRLPCIGLEEVPEPASFDARYDPWLGESLRRIVASLPETQRMAVILRYQEEMEPAEIAALLKMPLATVKSHLHRALGLLREKLERRGIGER
ncbi:MAG: RNA polymerase sigma factor [Bryobacteraceae bacterium]